MSVLLGMIALAGVSVFMILAVASRRGALTDTSLQDAIAEKMRTLGFEPSGPDLWRKERQGYLHMLEVASPERGALMLTLRSMPGPHMPQGCRLEIEGARMTLWFGGQRWVSDTGTTLAALFPHATLELERVRAQRAAHLVSMGFEDQTWHIQRTLSTANSGLTHDALPALAPELARQMVDVVEAMRWPETKPAALFRLLQKRVPLDSPERVDLLSLLLTSFGESPVTRTLEKQTLQEGTPRELLEVFRRSTRSIVPRVPKERLPTLLHELLRHEFSVESLPPSIYKRLEPRDIARTQLPTSVRLELLRRHGPSMRPGRLSELLSEALSKTLRAEDQRPWFGWIREHGDPALFEMLCDLGSKPGAVRATNAWFEAFTHWCPPGMWSPRLEALWLLGLDASSNAHHALALQEISERGGRACLPRLHAAIEGGHPAGSMRLQRAMDAITARVGHDPTRGMLTLTQDDARRGALTAQAERGAITASEGSD